MKKDLEILRKKTIKELEKEINKQRKELAKLRLEMKVNFPKDTNQLSKMRRKLAQIITIWQEKRLEAKLKEELKS